MKLTVEGIEFVACAGVYLPSDDSYLLVESLKPALERRVARGVETSVLDMGCGSGIVSVFVKGHHPAVRVVAVDVSKEAVDCTRKNLAALASHDRYRKRELVVEASLFDGLASGEKFDIVAFNPPYLPSDPREDAGDEVVRQWDGGLTGIELTVEFLRGVGTFLKGGGEVLLVASSLADLGGLEGVAQSLGFRVEVAGRFHAFFEELACWRLTRARRPPT
ncbi:MAG: HemK2/MTQ2 family protein methyltransferase [Promethearchaeota archaeon]